MKTNELKCTDLRINNYVNIEGDVVKVKEIYEKSIHYANDEYESYATEDFIQPIELTEDLLLKIGFYKHDEAMNIYALENERAIVVYIPNRRLLRIECVENNVLIDRNIILNNVENLHQLQNAYYLLTGEGPNIEL